MLINQGTINPKMPYEHSVLKSKNYHFFRNGFTVKHKSIPKLAFSSGLFFFTGFSYGFCFPVALEFALACSYWKWTLYSSISFLNCEKSEKLRSISSSCSSICSVRAESRSLNLSMLAWGTNLAILYMELQVHFRYIFQ
jgi:hypothetical protein